MIYRPKTGSMWDPSVIWHDGKYYAFMMYNKDGPNGLGAGHCFLASSEDGVYWEDEGIVNEEQERERGCKFFKCFVGRCGARFIMDHGVARPEGQDTLRFYESTDLKHWTYLFSNNPDPRWYTRRRWDHMYILPKEEGNPAAGYWGHPVAIAKSDLPRGVGMMESPDGRTWEALPPAKVEWGDMPPRDFEWGGCERLGGKYYLIGGTSGYVSKGYSMYVFVADDPRGPFCPDTEAYRLCGSLSENVSWLAAWCRGNGELLISNYASMELGSRSPWMLPLRKPVVDKEGHLRLGWWPANECLKEMPLSLTNTSVTLDTGKADGDYQSAWLNTTFNLRQGAILEGTIKAGAVTPGDNYTAGFVLDEGSGGSMAIQLGIGAPQQRETHIGRLRTEPDGALEFVSEDVTGSGCATVTGIEDGKEHTFRLLVRLGGFELYIDDLLMQTYIYQPFFGKVGFLARNAEAVFSDLRAWSMSLPAEASFSMPTSI
ncbi:MAG: hypothetical protein H8D56_25845 [Planctomycetes bacterium]|nr:hypothetical protein [Planctomycetota bacterium]